MPVTLQFKRGLSQEKDITNDELFVDDNTQKISVGPSSFVGSSREINYSAMTKEDQEMFALTPTSDGVLVDYHGNPVRMFGFTAGPALSDILIDDGNPPTGLMLPTWQQQRGADSLIYNLKRLSGYGIDHILLTLPNYNADAFRTTYENLGKDEYYRRVKQIFRIAWDCRIRVTLFVWNGKQTHLDIWGADQEEGSVGWNFIEDDNHPIAVRWRAHMDEMLSTLVHERALAGYQLTDEWQLKAEWNYAPSVSESSGSLPSYDTVNGTMTWDRLVAQQKLLSDAIYANDPYGRFVAGGYSGSAGSLSTFQEELRDNELYDTHNNATSKNHYTNSKISNDSWQGHRDSTIIWRRAGKDLGKPHLDFQSGQQLGDRYKFGRINTFNGLDYPAPASPQMDIINHYTRSMTSSGIQMVSYWDLARFVSDDPFYVGFDVHPDNVECGNNQWFEEVANANLFVRNEGYVDPYDLPFSKFSARSDKSLRLSGTGSLSYNVNSITHDSPRKAHQEWPGYTAGFWLKVDEGMFGKYIIDTIVYDDNPRSGFQVSITTDGGLKTNINYPDATDSRGYGNMGVTLRSDSVGTDWNYVMVQLDEYRLSIYLNGLQVASTTHYVGEKEPGISSVVEFPAMEFDSTVFTVGSPNPGGGRAFLIGNIKDLTVFNRPLTHFEMWSLYMHNIKPQYSIKYEFKYEEDFNSSDGVLYPTMIGETPSIDSTFANPDLPM